MVAYTITLKHDDEDLWIVVEAETGVPYLTVPAMWDAAVDENGVLDRAAVWEGRLQMFRYAKLLRELGNHVQEIDWTAGELMA